MNFATVTAVGCSFGEGSRQLEAVLAALANPVRRLILEVLLDHDSARSINEIANTLEVSRFTASHHLSILREAGLL